MKPFHYAILPVVSSESLPSNAHSPQHLVGHLKNASLIALDNHKEAERSKELTGQVSQACLDEIERARAIVDKGHGLDYPEMVKRVLKMSRQEQVSIRTITDVYIKTH